MKKNKTKSWLAVAPGYQLLMDGKVVPSTYKVKEGDVFTLQRAPKYPIGSIMQEKRACEAAFRKNPKARYAWCLHHEILWEEIEENTDWCGDDSGWMGRINYIMKRKDSHERAIRLRNFRPIKGKFDPNHGTTPLNERAMNRQWPGNTWNGRSIFSDGLYH